MRIFILIISPVFLGLLAGFLYWSRIPFQLDGSAIVAGLLIFGAVVAPRSIASFRSLARSARQGYRKPEIVRASVGSAILLESEGEIRIGEFLIEASHSKHVSSRLPYLPTGAIIQTLERGRLYRLRFPILLPPGRRAQLLSGRRYVEEAARANGYPGKIL